MVMNINMMMKIMTRVWVTGGKFLWLLAIIREREMQLGQFLSLREADNYHLSVLTDWKSADQRERGERETEGEREGDRERDREGQKERDRKSVV